MQFGTQNLKSSLQVFERFDGRGLSLQRAVAMGGSCERDRPLTDRAALDAFFTSCRGTRTLVPTSASALVDYFADKDPVADGAFGSILQSHECVCSCMVSRPSNVDSHRVRSPAGTYDL